MHRHPPARALVAALLAIGSASVAYGHGMRLPFNQWGGFSGETLGCQRIIARAAAQCAAARWHARRACRSALLAGEPCDETATDAVITAARNKSLDLIDAYCSERQFANLQFLGQFDVQGDVGNFCQDWELAATSAVFDGAKASGPTEDQRACIDAAADAVDAVMQFTFRQRRQCMDRVASLPTDAANRMSVITAADERDGVAYAAIAVRLARRCPAPSFAALYGRSPTVFVSGIGTRANCIGAQFYVQDAVLCPASVCGNGIVEPGETCDDGNADDGDGCPANCHD